MTASIKSTHLDQCAGGRARILDHPAIRSLLAWYSLVCSGSTPRVELYFGATDAETNQAQFEKFVARREHLEERFGGALDFQPLPGRKACRIAAHASGTFDVLDHNQHPALAEWFLETMVRFRAATQEVRTLITVG